MAYINSTRTVVNNVGTDIALAGAGNLFTVSGSLGGTKSLTLSDGFINNGAPEANLIVPLLFPNGHNDLGPSLYLEITVAGVTNPIPVVSNQNGTLLPIPHHEMTEGGSTVYKVVDPNTILNVYYTADYDGNGTPAFVVVGNPLVLSSSSYAIYANGYNDCWTVLPYISPGNPQFVIPKIAREVLVSFYEATTPRSKIYNTCITPISDIIGGNNAREIISYPNDYNNVRIDYNGLDSNGDYSFTMVFGNANNKGVVGWR